MNLQELQPNKKTVIVKRALREHYEIDVDFERLNLKQTQKMLSGVRGLIKEARSSKEFHQSHKNNAYLKLVMMEQALSDHLGTLRMNQARIVVENEEVQKSQVILAAQDMIDSVQKMLEQVSKMNVEELNAVVTGMSNEFGTEVSEQFNTAAGQALTTLQQAITTAKSGLTTALGAVTGDAPVAPGADAAMGADMGAMPPEGDLGADMGAMPPEGDLGGMEEPMEPEAEPDVSGAGRERR